jgi:outer membrane autotransporter protein
VNGVVNFTGLETFNNTGRVELRDSAVGDQLNLGTAAFVGGTNSRLGVDVNLATTTADVLVTGAATGSTIIDVNLLSPPIFNLTGTLVVDAAAGTSATAFTLAGGTQNFPYIRLNLLYDAPNNNFLIQALPDQAVFETVEQAEMVTNFWYQGTDAVSAQLEAARDGLAPLGTVRTNNLAGDGRFGGWVQVLGGNINREAAQSFTNGGTTTVFDTSYEQDFKGVQAGLDWQSGGTIFGVTFGYGKSDADFDVTANSVSMDGYNVGAYMALRSGGFFFNAIGKVDWVNVDATPGAGLVARFDATAWGLRGSAGYRFHSGHVFFEPSVSLSWVNVDINDYAVSGASVAFDDIESFRGAAGLRVGGEFRTANGGTWSPFVGIYAVDEFSGDNRATFTLGQVIALEQDAPGTYGEVTAGLNYSTGRMEVFARGEVDFGGERDGLSGRAGIRLRF